MLFNEIMADRREKNMRLCAGQCRYLITVYHLTEKNQVVKSVDIAKTLSVTRPSVSRMLKCMSKLEFIDPNYSASVRLTEKGFETAKKLVRNFEDVNLFFEKILKLGDDEAYEQSIQFLASFPEHTIERLSMVTRNTIHNRNKSERR